MFNWKMDIVDGYNATGDKYHATVGQFHGSEWEWYLEIKQEDGSMEPGRSGTTFPSSKEAMRDCEEAYRFHLQEQREKKNRDSKAR